MTAHLHRAPDPRTDHAFHEADRLAPYGTPYPSGWYRVVDTRDLRPGAVRAIDAFGKHLVAFRGTSGTVSVLDAHCPHQGASLAGGAVDGDVLTCPFHRWAFDGQGKLAAIPGLERVPRTGVCAYPTTEAHGAVWMYHDVSGAPVTPPYPFEPSPEVDAAGMVPLGRYDAGLVGMHIQEFAENSVDFQHFQHVHHELTVPWTTWKVPGAGMAHTPRWCTDPERPPVSYFEVETTVTWRGQPMSSTTSTARVTMFGPGGAIWFHFDIPRVGEVVLYQTHLPVGPLSQHVVFRWFAAPSVSRWWAWVVVGQWIANWKADISIWENKVFRPKPVLVSLDGPVRAQRAWYAQFGESAAS